jgi:hypothetical protein
MKWLRRPVFRLVAVLAVVAGALGWWWLARDEPPMDEELLAAVRPVIDEQLPRAPEVAWGGMLTGAREGLPTRWFCATTPIEVRRQGKGVRVGMIAHCAEYGLRDGALVGGSGSSGAMAVTVTDNRLTTVDWARDGAAHEPSIRTMFTPAGAKEALRAEQGGASPDVADQARRHFGLPENAPVLPR